MSKMEASDVDNRGGCVMMEDAALANDDADESADVVGGDTHAPVRKPSHVAVSDCVSCDS